jgi:hypothetical protein
MMTKKAIPFADLRGLLQGLGYAEKATDKAQVFHRGGKDMLVLRRYRDEETVDLRDLVSTRKFLDTWGLLEASEFDAFLQRATTSA